MGPFLIWRCKMKNVVALLYPGCISFEIALATELLAKKYKIIYATPDGSDHLSSNGMTLKAHTSFKNINLADTQALIVPGGDSESIKDSTDSDDLMRAANDKKLWIAAICMGPYILAKAGILRDRKISHGLVRDQIDYFAAHFKGVELTNDPFTWDQNIITARPEAFIDFAVELASRLEAIDPLHAMMMKDYYRGTYGQKIRPLALGMFKNAKGQFLYHQGYDRIKKEAYYRPLGGGIEFAEQGTYTLKREIQEELGLEVTVHQLLASFENIFKFEERNGHEVIMLFKAEFNDKSAYEKDEFELYETGHSIARAVWRSIDEIKAEGANLYPAGLEELIKKL
jgi:putative intracellular protease/amidase/ADP-ribose pyrophosphatase YjhB (NUDIX family)